MSLSIQTNVNSLVAQQNLNVNNKFQSKTIQQLTSGYRINSSGDDAAGLAVANKFRNSIAEITQGVANGNDAVAQLQIMDGGMANIGSILDRLKTLAAQSASGSFTGDRTVLNKEFQTDLQEIDRQAQAIGLNTGGTFAKSLGVYLGGGGGAGDAAVAQNGQVTVDLSASTVDAHSLGLTGMGMQVVAGTADISSNSADHSAYQILTNGSNLTGLNSHTTFYLSGPGFADANRVKLSVDLNGVNDTNTLVTAINDAITSAAGNADGSLSASAALALKSAGITSLVNTDTTGAQELAFRSNTTAFQVEAGDQMANALMGNLSTDPATPAQGLAIASKVTGALTTAGDGTAFTPTNVTVQISGAGLASPYKLDLTSSGVSTMKTAVEYIQTQVANNAAMQAAGITVTTAAAGSAMVFTSATGEAFSVQVTGDTTNALGLGSLNISSTASSPTFYSTITGANYSATVNGNGLATLGFSLNGGTTDGGVPADTTEAAAKITGTAPTGINGSAQVDTTALGSTPFSLRVNGTQVDVDFSHDANVKTTETLANVVKYINSRVNAAMGWGSNVQLASVAGAGASSTINLTDPFADSNSILTVISGGTALGLSGTSTGTDAVGNTVTVNLAAGDASSASYTSQATAGALTNGIDTSAGGTVNFTVDGQTVAADFSQNTALINGVAANAGLAAVFTGAKLGANATSPINLSSLQAQAASVTGNAFGIAATIDTSSLKAQKAVFDGGNVDTATVFASPLGAVDITIKVGGVAQTPVDLTGAASLADVAGDINTAAIGVAATVQTDANTGASYLELKSTATGTAASIQVEDNATAESLGLTSGGADSGTLTGADAQTMQVAFSNLNGGVAVTVNFANDGSAGPGETQTQIKNFLNTQLNTLFGTQANNYTYAQFTAGGALQIVDPTDATGAATVTVTKGTAAEALGLANALQTGNTSGTGVAAKTLSVTIDGGAAKLVDFTGDTNVGSGETLQQVADYVNTRLNAGYGTNGVVYAAINNGALEIAGQTPGSAVGKVIVGNGGAAALLGLNTTGAAVTVNAKNESVANVVAYLNSAAQKALGTSDAASIFTVDGAGAISIASQTKGAVSKFTMGSNSGAGATIATALGLDSPTTVTSGKNASLSSIASTLTQAFRANDTLNKAGLQATQSGSGLNVASSNGTSFRLAEYNTGAVNGGAASTLGFTSNGGPFAMALVSGVSKATMLDAGGTSAIGTGTTDNPYVSFKAMQFGSDAQTLTFTANNTAGVQQPLTITLHNDTGSEGGATSGASIDSAVAYINSQLQGSKNATLQSIVAVKENVGGEEQINFLSSLSSFSVSVGNSVNGNGLNGGTAKTYGSVSNGAAANSAIDTADGAQAAVMAISSAVAKLGSAQAAVGKGENQLGYAINLAQSQITNFSAAEAQIRDANVAEQAANLTKAQVLQQASIAAMAQANSAPQAILALLRG
ncbi:MAG: hypothetical protein LAP87_23710 [Acidobacteriia bacterium]|nr:hypothetical protein [Terriglobia bacterium]